MSIVEQYELKNIRELITKQNEILKTILNRLDRINQEIRSDE